MASIITTFDKMSSGEIVTTGTDNWIDILSLAPDVNSPIPTGKQIWIGYVTCISPDKNATFELRPNLPTKSLGNTTETQLRGFQSVPGGDSKEMDLYYYGAILTVAPVTASSTGVEKLWLRITCGSNASAKYQYIINYALV